MQFVEDGARGTFDGMSKRRLVDFESDICESVFLRGLFLQRLNDAEKFVDVSVPMFVCDRSELAMI